MVLRKQTTNLRGFLVVAKHAGSFVRCDHVGKPRAFPHTLSLPHPSSVGSAPLSLLSYVAGPTSLWYMHSVHGGVPFPQGQLLRPNTPYDARDFVSVSGMQGTDNVALQTPLLVIVLPAASCTITARPLFLLHAHTHALLQLLAFGHAAAAAAAVHA